MEGFPMFGKLAFEQRQSDSEDTWISSFFFFFGWLHICSKAYSPVCVCVHVHMRVCVCFSVSQVQHRGLHERNHSWSWGLSCALQDVWRYLWLLTTSCQLHRYPVGQLKCLQTFPNVLWESRTP